MGYTSWSVIAGHGLVKQFIPTYIMIRDVAKLYSVIELIPSIVA